MQQFYLYILISALTIASPGPGVLLTLTNTLNYNLRYAIVGIAGVSVGMGLISVFAASSVGLIIVSSRFALSLVKLLGAAYLVYLGVRLFKAAPRKPDKNSFDHNTEELPSAFVRFKQGLFVSLLNPKPIVFFIALFPQFINTDESFVLQFFILSSTFCILVFIIHMTYAFFASAARKKISSDGAFAVINKVGGCVFIVFATGLLYSFAVPYLEGYR